MRTFLSVRCHGLMRIKFTEHKYLVRGAQGMGAQI